MGVRSPPVAHCRDIRCIAIDKPLDLAQPEQSSTHLPSRFRIEERQPGKFRQAETCIRSVLERGALWILRSGAVVVDFVFAIPLDTRIIGNDMFAYAACDAGCTAYSAARLAQYRPPRFGKQSRIFDDHLIIQSVPF